MCVIKYGSHWAIIIIKEYLKFLQALILTIISADCLFLTAVNKIFQDHKCEKHTTGKMQRIFRKMLRIKGVELWV